MAKQSKTVELFLALGLATALGACNTPSTSSGEGSGAVSEATPAATTHAGGESHAQGGEGGEGGSTSGNADVDYMVTLGLMKGHLLVAEELREQGNYEEAEPHMSHPVDELYGSVEGQLSERNVPEFKSTLVELQDLAKSAPDRPQTTTAFNAAEKSIDDAIAALPAEQRQSPEFVVATIQQMLTTAADEYEAAIAEGKFVELVEYQDSRGFVLYAEELYKTIAEQMSQENPAAHQVITSSLAELKTAWPAVNPPATPVKTPSEVRDLVSKIKL